MELLQSLVSMKEAGGLRLAMVLCILGTIAILVAVFVKKVRVQPAQHNENPSSCGLLSRPESYREDIGGRQDNGKKKERSTEITTRSLGHKHSRSSGKHLIHSMLRHASPTSCFQW
jgi:hypothetical protein